jgi:colicin import membrane protein
MTQRGVVLRRRAGSNRRFADFPTCRPAMKLNILPTIRSNAKKSSAPKISEKATSKAAVDFEHGRKKRDAERRRDLAEEAKKRERRDRAIAKAQAAFDKAEREHDVRASDIEAELDAA